MTEWNKYPETYPTSASRLLVVINNEILVARSIFECVFYYYLELNEIVFVIERGVENTSGLLKFSPMGGKWIKPKLYAEVTHWMQLPEVPNDRVV